MRSTVQRLGLLMEKGSGSTETRLAKLTKEQNQLMEMTKALRNQGVAAEMKMNELMIASGQVGK